MKKMIIVVIAAGAAAAAWYFFSGAALLSGRDAFEVSGIIECEDVGVGSKEGGRVSEVMVSEGDRVKAGQALVRLEGDTFKAMLEEARAAERAAEANLKLLRKGYTREEVAAAAASAKALESQADMLDAGSRAEQIDAAAADYASARAQFDNLKLTYERLARLQKSGLASEQDADNARTAMETAERRMETMKAVYDMIASGPRGEEKATARHRVEESRARFERVKKGAREEEIEAAEAALEQARAHVRLLETRLRETEITAPADAVVDVLDLHPGDLVAPGEQVARLVLDGGLWVRVFVPEDRLGAVRQGRKVKLFVDSFPGEPFEGDVARVSRRAEFTPRNVQTPEGRATQVFRVKITIADPSGRLRAGMTATVRFKVQSSRFKVGKDMQDSDIKIKRIA